MLDCGNNLSSSTWANSSSAKKPSDKSLEMLSKVYEILSWIEDMFHCPVGVLICTDEHLSHQENTLSYEVCLRETLHIMRHIVVFPA